MTLAARNSAQALSYGARLLQVRGTYTDAARYRLEGAAASIRTTRPARLSPAVRAALAHCESGRRPTEEQLVTLFAADGPDFFAVAAAADAARARAVGDEITYVVNRNINYTNICTHRCGFCAFAKGRSARSVRGPGYLLETTEIETTEIEQRVAEAAARGATEVCLQGGIHPSFTGETYLGIVQAAIRAAPDIHVHAFSPLEIRHGAATARLPLREYLASLQAAGLRSLPGTAAEILCDDVRRTICPDKLTSDEWLAVMRTAHGLGLRSTATIMFGHVETPQHWARHLLLIRALQEETGGFTEFVPLPFVHMEAPMWRQGRARSGPSWREAVLMHAVARLALGRRGRFRRRADERVDHPRGGRGQRPADDRIRHRGRHPLDRSAAASADDALRRANSAQRNFGMTCCPMISSASIG